MSAPCAARLPETVSRDRTTLFFEHAVPWRCQNTFPLLQTLGPLCYCSATHAAVICPSRNYQERNCLCRLEWQDTVAQRGELLIRREVVPLGGHPVER